MDAEHSGTKAPKRAWLLKALLCQPHLIPMLFFVYQTPVYRQIGIKQFFCLIVTHFRKPQIALSIEWFGLERFLTISENQIHLLGINACHNWDNSRINFFSFLNRQPNIIRVIQVGVEILAFLFYSWVALGKWLNLSEPLGPHQEDRHILLISRGEGAHWDSVQAAWWILVKC